MDCTRLFEDGARKPVPSGRSACRQVKRPAYKRMGLALGLGLTQNMGGCIGDISRPSGCAVLVVDDSQIRSFTCEPQYRLNEVLPARRIDPGRSQNEMVASRIAGRLFTFQFAASIGAQRTDAVVFHVM